MNTHGKHVMLDLQYDPVKTNLTTEALMNFCFQYIGEAITENSNMKIIDKVKHLFDEPPGFTIFYCLDESHCSLHSYTNRGLLSLDCYTCGETNPIYIMEAIEVKLRNIISDLKVNYSNVVRRFYFNKN
jgi:S-adenosylmethionine/arginine decarboxylase-like enzyme